MPIIAYKMFDPGLICRGHKFKANELNVTEKANCAQNGFHCAENPLDCLTYYPNFAGSECWEVVADGDIDEDERDSKISCTEMRLIRKLDLQEFLAAALLYMAKHPAREWNSRVQTGCGMASEGFAIVRGNAPMAAGARGDLLALMAEDPQSGKLEKMSILVVDGVRFKPGVYYNSYGEEREEDP